MRLSVYIKNTSAATLARISGVSKASLSYFLSGKRGLSASNMAKIVKATRGLVTYEEIIAEIEEICSKRKRAI